MKKVAAVLAGVVLVASLVSPAFAADKKKGTIKSVDTKAGTVLFTADGGKDETLKADTSVDLGKVKAGEKVEITVENDTVKSLKAAKPKAPVGC
jgi:hypothetical protein